MTTPDPRAAKAAADATRRYQAARTPQARAKAAKSVQANVSRLRKGKDGDKR